MAIKGWIDELADFVKNVYLVDVAAIGAFYAGLDPDRRGHHRLPVGAGYPARHQGHPVRPARRLHRGRRPGQATSRSRASATRISATASRKASSILVQGRQGRAASLQGRDRARIHRLPGQRQIFLGQVAHLLRQDRPRSARWRGCSAWWRPTTSRPVKYVTQTLDTVGALAKTKVRLAALHSTIGRHAARAVSCAVQVDVLGKQWTDAGGQHRQGRRQDLQQAGVPEGRSQRRRLPRSAARRAVALGGDQGRQDQELPGVVPTTWNAAPRNEKDEPGPYEASLLEHADGRSGETAGSAAHHALLRPCMACAVHVLDDETAEVVKVKVL